MVIIMIIVTGVFVNKPELNTNKAVHSSYLFVKSIMNLIDIFSSIFFWFLFALTGYWFIFFKLQERVYCFLPGLNTYISNYRPFDIMFGLVASSKLVYMFFRIQFE